MTDHAELRKAGAEVSPRVSTTHEDRSGQWLRDSQRRYLRRDVSALAAEFAQVEREAIERAAVSLEKMLDYEAAEHIRALLPGDGGRVRESAIGRELPAGFIEKHGLIDPSNEDEDRPPIDSDDK